MKKSIKILIACLLVAIACLIGVMFVKLKNNSKTIIVDYGEIYFQGNVIEYKNLSKLKSAYALGFTNAIKTINYTQNNNDSKMLAYLDNGDTVEIMSWSGVDIRILNKQNNSLYIMLRYYEDPLTYIEVLEINTDTYEIKSIFKHSGEMTYELNYVFYADDQYIAYNTDFGQNILNIKTGKTTTLKYPQDMLNNLYIYNDQVYVYVYDYDNYTTHYYKSSIDGTNKTTITFEEYRDAYKSFDSVQAAFYPVNKGFYGSMVAGLPYMTYMNNTVEFGKKLIWNGNVIFENEHNDGYYAYYNDGFKAGEIIICKYAYSSTSLTSYADDEYIYYKFDMLTGKYEPMKNDVQGHLVLDDGTIMNASQIDFVFIK